MKKQVGTCSHRRCRYRNKPEGKKNEGTGWDLFKQEEKCKAADRSGREARDRVARKAKQSRTAGNAERSCSKRLLQPQKQSRVERSRTAGVQSRGKATKVQSRQRHKSAECKETENTRKDTAGKEATDKETEILDLLHIQNSSTARQFQRVATETFLKMGRDQPQLAETYLILPMLKPLLYRTSTEEKCPAPGETLLSESVLLQCIEDIVKVFVVGNNPTAAILKYSRQILLVIFSFYCFARQNASHIRAPCQDILLWVLEKSDREAAVSALAELCGMESSLQSLPYYSHIKCGSQGGAMIIVREDQ
ncbi:unnamed protein product, partial [Ranitomeya imitator]